MLYLVAALLCVDPQAAIDEACKRENTTPKGLFVDDYHTCVKRRSPPPDYKSPLDILSGLSRLDAATTGCVRDGDQCPIRDRLRFDVDQLQEREWVRREEIERAAREAEATRQREADEAAKTEAEQQEAALQKKCGKDAHRMKVGMTFGRVKQCSGGEFFVLDETANAARYETRNAEGETAYVFVRQGKITQISYR